MSKFSTVGIGLLLIMSAFFSLVGSAVATPDTNNDFTEAVEVFNNDFKMESLDIADDLEDYYKIYLEAGEWVRADLLVPIGSDFDLYLYDTTFSMVSWSEIDNPGTANYNEGVVHTASTTGWHYLKVSVYSGSGNYFMWITATADWTFMVYMDGDNNLEEAAIEDFLEMSSVGSTADVNIVVQLDRWDGYPWNDTSASWDNYEPLEDTRYDNWTDCHRFLVTWGMTPTTGASTLPVGEANMGDPANLVSFADWGIMNYPAHNYALVLWDHGMDWYGACSDDNSSGDYLTLPELSLALQTIQSNNGGLVLDIVGFDACNMGSVEVGYQTWIYSDYIVASEMMEPGLGWNYQLSLDALITNPDMTAKQLSSQIVHDYVDSYRVPYYFQDNVTLSAVKSSDVYWVMNYAHELATELITNMTQYVNYINYSRLQTETYEGPYGGELAMIDLYHFAQLLYDSVPSAVVDDLAIALMNAIDTAVVAEDHFDNGLGIQNAHGITIYFPPTQLEYDTAYETDPYLNFTLHTDWDEFLNAFYTELALGNTAPTVDTFDPLTDPTIDEGQSQTFTITASDVDGNALGYWWELNGVEISGATGPSYTFDADYNSAGAYTVDAYVWDGEVFASYSWTLTVNDVPITPPTSSVNPISPYKQESSATITATATQGTLSIADVTLWYKYSADNSSWGSWKEFGKDTVSPWSWAFNFPNGDGHYEFYSIATDSAGFAEAAPANADAYCLYDTSSAQSTDDTSGTNDDGTGDGTSDVGPTDDESDAGTSADTPTDDESVDDGTEGSDADDGGGGSLPGFELWTVLMAVVSAFVVVSLLSKKRKGR